MAGPRRKKYSKAPKKLTIQSKSNALCVISIPELLILVVQELDTMEHRKLIEQELRSAIPEQTINPSLFLSKPNLRLSSKILIRYDIYAPWIQELEIYGGYYQEIINPDWLITLLDGRLPLPNLRRPTAHTTAPIGGEDLMGVFNMFINPSLTEIRTVIPNKGLPIISSSRVPVSSVPAFLDNVKKTCPHIQVLEFYPENACASNWSRRYIPSEQSRSILSSFINLRSFSSTTYILEPTIFGVLGELPHLESLGIRGATTERPVLDKELCIPETWFPVLKELRLYDVDPEDIQVLWKQSAFIKKLKSAFIQTDDAHRRYADNHPLHGKNWAAPFLESLPHLSPHLQDVTIYMGGLDNRIEIPREHWKYLGMNEDLYYAYDSYRAVLYVRRQQCVAYSDLLLPVPL
ncbi:hypothetical protein OPQ81_005983 [Rhizoctonia solani]|nr:hypothetical protein OPQ81_005983 [Rhizoctonia solani]